MKLILRESLNTQIKHTVTEMIILIVIQMSNMYNKHGIYNAAVRKH